jgi:hypothetical protein
MICTCMDKSNARRLPRLASWMAGIYLVYSLLVYFGSLGREGHDWWPMFLYPIIWPLSWLIELASRAIYNPLNPMMADHVSGAFYIVSGTVWLWLLGRLISIVVIRVLPKPEAGRR